MRWHCSTCGDYMPPIGSNEEATLRMCPCCLKVDRERNQVRVAESQVAENLRGFVKMDQVIQGFKGGRIYRRMW